MNYWIKLLLTSFFAFLLIPTVVHAQTEELVKINEFWTGASLNYRLNKKIDFSLDQQVRITDNLNRVRNTFFEFGARYRFNKHFSVRAQHRYIIRNEARHVNRYTLDGTGKFKLKPAKLDFAYRLRMQHAITTFTKEPETYLRNRFQIRYRALKKVRLFARYESFYQFNDKSRFRHHLFATGVDFKLNKQLDLSVFYRLDQKINTNNPERRNIIAVLVSFEI
jgi:predicted porin